METVSEWPEREKLLRTLSLVSRQFRDIAQPLLGRIFRPKANKLSLAASFPHLAQHVRIFVPRGLFSSEQVIFEAVDDMPALVELRLAIEQYDSSTRQTNLVELLGKQLDTIQVAIWTHESFPSDLLNRDVPVLLGFSLSWVDELAAFSRFQHFHLMGWQDSWYDQALTHRNSEDALHKLVKAVANQPHMRSLSLPSQLHASSPSLKPEHVSVRDELLTPCAVYEVDIIWRLDSKDPLDDPGVSRDFWRYAQELKKKKKALEVEGGVGGSVRA
ncbi:hypothetical protein JCM8547_002709 [Rhodosporidiobolus lusitaniae]